MKKRPILIKNSPLPEKEDIYNFETKFKILLPESFKKFLLQYNGCEMDDKYRFFYKEPVIDEYSDVVLFYDLDRIINCLKLEIESDENKEEQNDDDLFYVYDDSDYEYLSDNSSIFLKNKMIIIGDTASSILCISYDDNNYGKIYEIDTSHDCKFILLSNSIDDFINQISINPDYEENT